MPTLTLDDVKALAAIAQGAAALLAVVIGGVWALSKYYRSAEYRATPSAEIELQYIGKQHRWWLLEVKLHVENKGKVPFRISKLILTVMATYDDDPPVSSINRKGYLKYMNDISESSMLSPNFASLIDPGGRATYTHIALAPPNALLVYFHIVANDDDPKCIRLYVDKTVPGPMSSAFSPGGGAC